MVGADHPLPVILGAASDATPDATFPSPDAILPIVGKRVENPAISCPAFGKTV
jgi:hypothetical protein